MKFDPAPEAKIEGNSGNSLFKFINRILKREVIAETKNITILKIGDKIQSNDGTFSLEIATFGPQLNFPIIFEPKAGEVLLNDKKITKIEGDFHDESAVYVLKDKTTSYVCKLCYLPAKATATDG